MNPICFRIGSFAIHWYGVFMALGFLAALGHWVYWGRREGRDFNFCSDLMVWAMLAGVVGARVAYVLANWEDYRSDLWGVFRVHQGGLVYYGGFVGAFLAILLFGLLKRQSMVAFLDFVISALPLGHALGRIGCFLNGCCHGGATDLPWGVRYPAHSLPWCEQVNGGLVDRFTPVANPVHPVQLYEAAFNLLVYGLLWVVYRRGRTPGRIVTTYLLVYPAGRFLLEVLRGDPRLTVGPFTMSQVFSLLLFTVGVGMLVYVRRMQRAV